MKRIALILLLVSPLFAIKTIPRGVDNKHIGDRGETARAIAEISKLERLRIKEYEIVGTASGYITTGDTYSYTIYGTTVSTSVVIGVYDEAKGGWLTNIAGVIVMVIGGVVYFLRRKND